MKEEDAIEHRWSKHVLLIRTLHLRTQTFHRHNWSVGCKLRYSVSTPETGSWSVTGPELHTSLSTGGHREAGLGSTSGAEQGRSSAVTGAGQVSTQKGQPPAWQGSLRPVQGSCLSPLRL